MTSPPINQKTFSLVNKISKTFPIIIANFAYAATLLFRIRDRLRLSFSPSFYMNFIYTLAIRRIRLVVSQVKLTVKITQTINARRIRLVTVMKERQKAVTTIYGRIRVNLISSARQRLISSIIIKKITLAISPILAQFYTLGYFDPQTLGTLDLLTLGEMDYTTS